MSKLRLKAKKQIKGQSQGLFKPATILMEPGEVLIYDMGWKAGLPSVSDIREAMKEKFGEPVELLTNYGLTQLFEISNA